ncbi:MAG: ketol-acid reductoisomerase [bacterium]|nr:ketol-acid reductoisomerase [bacterium]
MKFIKVLPLFVIVSIAGYAVASGLPERALVEIGMVNESIELEKELNSRENVPIPKSGKWFEVVIGEIPVVVTAPHATRPFRNGKRRFSDGGGTAALAVAVGQLTGATVMYTTYEGPSKPPSDPNSYDNSPFKIELGKVLTKVKPKFVLDIHGSHPHRSFDIDMGTMNGESLLGNEELVYNLIKHLRAEGINCLSSNRFAASKTPTITRFCKNNSVPAIQLEINSTWVSPGAGTIEAQRFSRLIQALTRFVRTSLK